MIARTFIAMYIERVPNRNSPPAVLLRESFREDGKVKKRTLANLSKLPDDVVDGLRILLKGGVALKSFGGRLRDPALPSPRARRRRAGPRPVRWASRSCSTAVPRGCGRWPWR